MTSRRTNLGGSTLSTRSNHDSTLRVDGPAGPSLSVLGAATRARIAALVALAVAAASLCGCGATAKQASSGTGLVARGRLLYKNDGCAGCHSLNHSRLDGPTFAGLANSDVPLSNGTSAKATSTFLMKEITGAEKSTVRGYPPALMEQATALLGLEGKPQDVRALAAFIESVR
jgi:mono/diheme cytochrome c family protein